MIATIARSEVTEWYPADVKPVHVGAYEWCGRFGEPHIYAYHWWDGKRWCGNPGYSAYSAELNKDDCGFDGVYFKNCCFGWRGLRSPA